MRRSTVVVLACALTALTADAGATPFASPLQVDRFELSGLANYVDEFDDGIFPNTAPVPWVVFCGAGSEAGGTLSITDSGPGTFCTAEGFVSGPVVGFVADTTLTVDFLLPLPAEGEAIGIQISTLDASDLINFGVSTVGGQVVLGVNDEIGLQSLFVVDPADLPAANYTLQIALVTDPGTGLLVPTIGASADGNPLIEVTLDPSLGLDPSLLGATDAYGAAIVAGFVPEPTVGALLLPGLAVALARSRSRRGAVRVVV